MAKERICVLEKLEGKTWIPLSSLHAEVNKASGKEYLDAGALQSQMQMVFTVRFCALIADIKHNTQLYRIKSDGGTYKVVDYDDFKALHNRVRLLGVSYRG